MQTVVTVRLSIEQFRAEVRRLNLHYRGPGNLHICLTTGDAYQQPFNVQQPEEFETDEERAEYIEELRLRVLGYWRST